MTFPRYTFDKIRQIADECRSLYWPSNKIPVDIDHIIEFGYKLKIIPVVGLQEEHDMEGFLYKDLSSIAIDNRTFNDPKYEPRARFTLAHELGHLVLHRKFFQEVEFANAEEWIKVVNEIDDADWKWYENHANEFAGRLLVPRDQLQGEVDSLNKDVRQLTQLCKERGLEDEIGDRINDFLSRKLCQRFFVSASVISTRLRKEQIQTI